MRGRTYCFLAKKIPHTGFQLPAGCPAAPWYFPQAAQHRRTKHGADGACRCWAAAHGQLSLPNSTAEEALAR